LAEAPDVDVMFTAWDARDGAASRHLYVSELLRDSGFVPRVYESAKFSKQTLVVSESLGGYTLRDLIDDHLEANDAQASLVLPFEWSLPLMADLLTSFAELEKLEAVCGDLIASSLHLVDGGRHLMLADLSAISLPGAPGRSAVSVRLPPEFEEGSPFAAPSAVWQAGLVSSSMFLPPRWVDFDVDTAEGRDRARTYNRDKFSLEEEAGFEDLPADIASILSGMLNKDPAARWTAEVALEKVLEAAAARGIDIDLKAHEAPPLW